MFTDNGSFSENGHQRQTNSNGSVHIGADNNHILNHLRTLRGVEKSLPYSKNQVPKMETKLLLTILAVVGFITSVPVLLFDITSWPGKLVAALAILNSVSYFIIKWVDKTKEWRLKDLEYKERQRALNKDIFE